MIAVSIGDPAGIGPEVACAAIKQAAAAGIACTAIGNRQLLERVALATGHPLPERIIDPGDDCDASCVQPGQCTAATGAAAVAAVEHGIRGCQNGTFAALVTAPLNKAAATAAGLDFPGHTELLAARCNLTASDVTMALVGGGLAVALVTCHQSLRSVPESLTSERIVHTTRLLADALHARLGRPAHLAVLGLNPHAGEDGLFGLEDQQIIAPAIAQLQADGISLDGPLPPDTAFTPAARARYDGHVAMYHDQGLTPFKALAFDEGVNLTLGLPIIRTSPDHGTALDIAWQGQANPSAMSAAIQLAADLVSSR